MFLDLQLVWTFYSKILSGNTGTTSAAHDSQDDL